MQLKDLGPDADQYDRFRSCAHTTGRLGAQLLLVLGLGFPMSAVAFEPTDCDPEPQTTTAYYGEFFDGANCTISSGDTDVFQFSAETGERVIVQVGDHSRSNPDPCITLLDPFGVPTPNGDTTCGEFTATITDDILSDGTYSILVQEQDTGSFPYGLALERLAPQPSPFAPIVCNGCTEGDVIDGGGDLDEHILGAAGDVVIAAGNRSVGIDPGCLFDFVRRHRISDIQWLGGLRGVHRGDQRDAARRRRVLDAGAGVP